GSAEGGIDWTFEDDEDRGGAGFLLGAVGAVWDLDLFGGLSRSREAAWAAAARQDALAEDAARLVTGAVAGTYIDLRATERRLALARQSLALQLRTLDLVEQRAKSGLAPGLDQVRAEAEVASVAALIGPLESEAARL